MRNMTVFLVLLLFLALFMISSCSYNGAQLNGFPDNATNYNETDYKGGGADNDTGGGTGGSNRGNNTSVK